MHFTDYDTRLAAYAVIVDDADRILLTWFNGSEPGWSLPGGGVEYAESPAQAVVREVHEEAGFHVEPGEVIAVDTFTDQGVTRPDRPYKGVRLLFDATITGGTLGTVEVGGTTDFARWVPLDQIEGHRADIVDLAVATWRARRPRRSGQ